MPPMQYINDNYNYSEKFYSLPLFWNFQDERLKNSLISFLETWNSPQHPAWQENHCPEMVDHALAHSRNLFMIANRLFHDNDNLIEFLNDGEKACLVYSIWLHDIGMSRRLFVPDEQAFGDLNTFIKQYPLKSANGSKTSIQLVNLSDITTKWIRTHHSLLSKYIIKYETGNINFYTQNDEDLRRIIGNICFNHSSKVKLKKEDKIREYYDRDPVNEQRNGIETLNIGYTTYNINLLFLSGLLRLIDGCDQSRKRLISERSAEAQLKRNIHVRDTIVNNLNSTTMDKNDQITISQLCNSFNERSKATNAEINKFESLTQKYPSIKDRIDELQHICCFRRNMDYKKSVNDIYFKDGKIVLALSEDAPSDDIKTVISDILHELNSVGAILRNPDNSQLNIGIPYCDEDPYDENHIITKKYATEAEYEAPEYEIYQRIGLPNFDQLEFIAQQHQEEYIRKQRDEGKSVINNPQMHLWNRIEQMYRDSNRRHYNDYVNFLTMINCEVRSKLEFPNNSFTFTDDEIELLSKQEHDNWMNEKINDGWIYNPIRNNDKKLHDCLIEWDDLPEHQRQKDRNIILKIPELLDKINLTIIRKL